MRKKFTNGDIVQKMYDLVGDEYTKVDDIYEGALVKFGVRHETCGFEYGVTWGNFQTGFRCPKCANCYRYTDEEITALVSKTTDGEYVKLSEYVNAQTKFKILHKKCGHEYKVTWDKLKQGKRCPKCNQSKGEKFISDCLINQNISFTSQVKFNDCRNERTLPFDFGIVDSNNNIIALIEFDGIQHFEPVERFGGEKAFELTQLRDSIKNDYCKDNNIPLLRVKYNENIEERLEVFLASLFV